MPWQNPGILYPDIELVLTDRYRSALQGRPEPHAQDVFISNKVPNPRRPRMIIVRRDGGTIGEMRDRPRVSLRIWGTSEQEATNLASLVLAMAPSFADGAPIVAVPSIGISGPFPVPDESGQPMRMMTVEFHTRGVPL